MLKILPRQRNVGQFSFYFILEDKGMGGSRLLIGPVKLFCFHSRWGFQKFWISHNKTISGDETKWTGWGARNYFSILYMLILKYGGAGIVETTNLVPSQPEALRDGFMWRSVTLATLDQISCCNRLQGRFSRITIEVCHLNQCSSIEFYSLLIK